MEMLDYKAEMLGDVAGLFTRGVANVPNCWPVDDADFAGGIAAVSGGECDGGPPVEDQALSVATVRGEVVGFAHFGIDRRDPDEPPRGAICFLYYERGCRSAGQGLLAATESTFAARSLTEVCAFDSSYRYRFYCFPHAYLSDHLDHVSALLQFNGYRLTGGEVFLNGLDYETAELPHADLDFDLAVTWPRERGRRPGCHVLAHRDGETIGECKITCGGDYSRHPDAQDFGFVDWLGVEKPYQHRGLGKLLLFHARNEMLAVGYRHTAISTARHNNRAFLFYSNHGYRVVDWTYQLSKSLDPA